MNCLCMKYVRNTCWILCTVHAITDNIHNRLQSIKMANVRFIRTVHIGNCTHSPSESIGGQNTDFGIVIHATYNWLIIQEFVDISS